jgi:peptide/nickel transport system substrate-binding protein
MLVTVVVGAASVAIGCGDDDGGAAIGGTLTIANPAFPPSLDPATGANEYSDYFNLAYDPLIVQAADGSFEPGLAESWEYGPRNESFTINLRSDVKFSDGTDLDAEAVKTWIEHALDLPEGRAPTYLGNLDSIDVTGPLSLTLNFSAPTPELELVFSQILEMGMVASPKAIEADTLATKTAGAGPYMLDPDETVTQDTYTYVPNPHYWNKDEIHWDKVVIKTIQNPNAALQALETGQVQVVKDQPPTNIEAAESAGQEYVAPPTLLLGLSLMDREGEVVEALGDPRVRQAINYAIDREAVAEAVSPGTGVPTTQMAAEGDDSYDPALEETYPYDPERARELLASAGYADGFTLPVVAATIVGQDRLAQALAGQLEEVGIRLKLDVQTDVGAYIEDLSSGSLPAATLSFGRLPAAINYTLLWGPDALPFNPFGSSMPELTSLNEELSAASRSEAPAIAQHIQRLLVDEAWFAPVVVTPLVVLHSPDVTGVEATDQRRVIYTTEIQPND